MKDPVFYLRKVLFSLRLFHVFITGIPQVLGTKLVFNPLNTELNPFCHLLALLEAHHILNVGRIRFNIENALLRWLRFYRSQLFINIKMILYYVTYCICHHELREKIDEAWFQRRGKLGLYWYGINRLTPNDPYMGRTAPLTSKRCILYIYPTNIGTEYFKHALYSPFFSVQNAVRFIMLTCLVPVLFTFYIQNVPKLKK